MYSLASTSNVTKGSTDYHRLLAAAYQAANEDGKSDAEVSFLLTKYSGHEEQLLDSVCQKYRIDKNGLLLSEQRRSQRSYMQSALAGASPPQPTHKTMGVSFQQQPQQHQQLLERYPAGGPSSYSLTAEEFALKQLDMNKQIEKAKDRLNDQRLQLSELLTERSALTQKQVEEKKKQQDEIAIITHTVAAMRIELLRLESNALAGHIPSAQYIAERRETEEVTSRLTEVLKLRRILEKVVRDYLALHPTNTAIRTELRVIDPAMATRLEVL